MDAKDEELVKRYQICCLDEGAEGLIEAGKAIYDRYGEQVLDWAESFAYRYRISEVLGDDETAGILEISEILNEIWLRVFTQLRRNAEKGKQIGRFRGWLYRLIRNVVKDKADEVWKYRRTCNSLSQMDDLRKEQMLLENQESLEMPDEIYERREASSLLDEASNALSDRELEVVALYRQGKSVEQIAKTVDRSKDAVYARLRSAIAKMKRKISQQKEEED